MNEGEPNDEEEASADPDIEKLAKIFGIVFFFVEDLHPEGGKNS